MFPFVFSFCKATRIFKTEIAILLFIRTGSGIAKGFWRASEFLLESADNIAIIDLNYIINYIY